MDIYLGLDASTQSLTATAIEVGPGIRRILFERSLVFDHALPSYGTSFGVLPSDDPLVRVAPPLMWAEALDRMMSDIAASGLDVSRVRAMSGSAQQHGSVYLARGAEQVLRQLDALKPLVLQLESIFSRAVSPIWMDASTRAECIDITQGLGGAEALARLTGSRAFERFTGPQIRKFARTEPEAYAHTERIHLVSSFLASLMIGGHAPLDPCDASGANLMNIVTRQWAPEALRATADHLTLRLPPIAAPNAVIGELAPYWRARYGFGPARVVVWSGDNPSSLVGTGLVDEDIGAISLGTSDTVFGLMREPRIAPAGGHVFSAPTGDYMGLTCFRNGSLARERVRDAYGLDWAGFTAALRDTPPGNRGGLMLPWFEPEITPAVQQPVVVRDDLIADDAANNVRAVVEAQMIAMARHSAWMGARPVRIHATGGAAVNREILQVMADVFAANVYEMNAGNTAALGAALRAYHADVSAGGTQESWQSITHDFVLPASSPVRPRMQYRAIYDDLIRRQEQLERRVIASFASNG